MPGIDSIAVLQSPGLLFTNNKFESFYLSTFVLTLKTVLDIRTQIVFNEYNAENLAYIKCTISPHSLYRQQANYDKDWKT